MKALSQGDMNLSHRAYKIFWFPRSSDIEIRLRSLNGELDLQIGVMHTR